MLRGLSRLSGSIHKLSSPRIGVSQMAHAVPTLHWGWQEVENSGSPVRPQRQCQSEQTDLDRRFPESLIIFVWSPRERMEGEHSNHPSWNSLSPQPSFFPPTLFSSKIMGKP